MQMDNQLFIPIITNISVVNCFKAAGNAHCYCQIFNHHRRHHQRLEKCALFHVKECQQECNYIFVLRFFVSVVSRLMIITGGGGGDLALWPNYDNYQ